jgi:hypothetical protein
VRDDDLVSFDSLRGLTDVGDDDILFECPESFLVGLLGVDPIDVVAVRLCDDDGLLGRLLLRDRLLLAFALTGLGWLPMTDDIVISTKVGSGTDVFRI